MLRSTIILKELRNSLYKLHQQSSEKGHNIGHRWRFFSQVEDLVDEIQRVRSNLHAFIEDTGSEIAGCHTSHIQRSIFHFDSTAIEMLRLPLTAEIVSTLHVH